MNELSNFGFDILYKSLVYLNNLKLQLNTHYNSDKIWTKNHK